MPIVPRNLLTKYVLNTTLDKGVSDYYSGCHGNLVTIAAGYVADAHCPKEPP